MGKRLIIKGASFSTNAIDRVTPSTTYYSVIYNLSHCSSSNSSTSVAAGSTYQVTITPQAGYTISNVVVRHNGQNVSPTSGYTYRITNVRGNITITATATADVTNYTITYDLVNATASNNATTIAAGSSYSVTLSPNSGYNIDYVEVTHNGSEVTPTSGYTYNIPSVSGNILVECYAVEQQTTDYTNKIIQGFWMYSSALNRTLSAQEFGDTDAAISRFVATTKDGHYIALGFGDGEITTTIPANSRYRVCMMTKSDGSSTTGTTASDCIRTDSLNNTKQIKISSNSISEIVGESTSSYPYWGINISKADNSDSTPSDMIAYGVKVEPTDSNVKIEQGFWALHAVSKDTSNTPNFVCPTYNGGLIPFSEGEYQIKIPSGNYKVILCTNVSGATGSMCRTNSIFVPNGTTISSNDLLTIMAQNAASAVASLEMDAYNSSYNYLGWSLHYCKSSTSTPTATSVQYAINEGLTIEKI